MKLKIILVFLFLVFGFLTFSKNALAANPYPINTNPDVPQDFHTYTQSVFIEIASTIACQLTGYDPANPNGKCLGIDPKTGKIGFVQGNGGAIGMMGGFIAYTFYIPVSTHDYGANLAQNFGIAKKTYAQNAQSQSLGFNALLPTLKLWETFRNITYMIFIILFVIIGLAIMFRVKIDPRTVMSVQNQIPKIIIALIFVTLSYAIAGFLIDMMYVSMYLVVAVFTQQGFNTGSAIASTPFSAIGGVGGISHIGYSVAGTISGVVKDMFSGTLGNVLGAIIGALIGKFIGGGIGGIPAFGPFGSMIGSTVGVVAGGLVGALFGSKIVGLVAGLITYVVVVVAIFTALLRLWLVLIKSYIYILITVVFAPFYIAFGLIPGRSGIGSWIRSMLANLSVFPVTVTMLLLGNAFVSGFLKAPPGNHPFVPPLIGNYLDPDGMAAIIGLAIILMLPEVANITRDTFKSPELKYSAAFGKGISAGAGIAMNPINQTMSRLLHVNPTTREAEGPIAHWMAGSPIGRFIIRARAPGAH